MTPSTPKTRSYPLYPLLLRKATKSKWFILLLLVPFGIYGLFLRFESEILSFSLPYFPDEPDKSVNFYRDLLHLAFREMLWYTGFIILVWIFGIYVLPEFNKTEAYAGTRATVIIGLVFITSVGVSYYTLDQFPNSSDEYAYLYQGETMSKGKLWEKSHDLPKFFYFNNIAQKDGIRVGRFPPGWPLFLAAAFYSGLPVYLVNPLLGMVSLVLFYMFARRLYGSEVALWSLAAMALSSYFIFTSASFFSHTSCMLATLAFVYCTHLYFEKRTSAYAVLAGIFIGLVAIIRYYTAVLIFIPFLIIMVFHLRWKAILPFLWMGIGSLPWLAFLFWYNYSITGSFLQPVTIWAYENESLGFVRGHSLIKGGEHITRWILMFLYWSSPGLLILYGFFLFQKIKTRVERLTHPEDYAFILLMAGYFLYYEIGGNQYGPRFLFEGLPFMILLVTRNVFQYRNKWIMALFYAGCIYAIVKIPYIAHREHKVILERNDLYRLSKAHNLHNAVVLIASRVSVIRPMPIGDLTRNDAEFQNDVLYAFDIPERNNELFKFYPDRVFYRYERDKNQVEGQLIKLSPY